MRTLLVCLGLGLGALAATGVHAALDRVDRPFPGFLVLENGVVASAGLAHWPAVGDGSLYQRTVVSVDGAPLRDARELPVHLDSLPAGTRVAYGLRGAGELVRRDVATRIFGWRDLALLHAAYLVNGLLLAAAGLAALRSRPGPTGAGAVAPLLLTGSVWGLTAMSLYGPYHLFRLHALSECLLFAAALHLALAFPRPLPEVRRRRWLLLLPYGAALGLAIPYQAWLHEPSRYVTMHLAATGAFGIGLLVLVASQMARLLAGSPPELRRSVQVMAVGSLVALVPAVALTAAEPFTGGRSPQNAIAFSAFLFPATVVWASRRLPCDAAVAEPDPG